MKNILLILIALVLSACSGSKSPDHPTIEQNYDLNCKVKTSSGTEIKYRFYYYDVDGSQYNLGIRKFVHIEVEAENRFYQTDSNEDADNNTYYQDKIIFINTPSGAYKVYYINNTVNVELNNTVQMVDSVSCL